MEIKMNKRFGDHVSVSLVIFTLGTLAIIASIYIYSKKDDSAYQQTLSVVESIKADFKKLEQLVSSNIATVGTGNVRIQDLEKKVEEHLKIIDGLESYCAKLKDSQIEMQDKLSQKRPVIKMQGPVQVELVPKKKVGAGRGALIKGAQ